MNPVTDIVFSVTWILLLIWAIRSMSRGWSVQDTSRPSGVWNTTVTKVQHPEMEGVRSGEELLVYTPEDEDDDDDDDGDIPLYTGENI